MVAAQKNYISNITYMYRIVIHLAGLYPNLSQVLLLMLVLVLDVLPFCR